MVVYYRFSGIIAVIALALNISEKTVKTHVSSILAKLNVTSRTQAALYAVRIGLVQQP